MTQELTADTDVESGDTITVEWDGNSISGEVQSVKGGQEIIVNSGDDNRYEVFVPQHSFMDWQINVGGPSKSKVERLHTGDITNAEVDR